MSHGYVTRVHELTESVVARLLDSVEAARDEIVRRLQQLVRIPSETRPPSGDELAAQRYVEHWFRELGWDVDVFEPWDVPGIKDHPGWWPGLDYEDRPNVVARCPGTGGGKSLILNGHIDVVPAGPRELWSVDPYGGEIRNGHLFGRGAADMKAGIVAMTVALICVQRSGIRLKGDVTVESVVNEELGGFNGTLACCVAGYEADAAIVTEPTGGDVVVATKGGQAYRVKITGEAVHHGMWWRGQSALDKALILKDGLRDWEQLRTQQFEQGPHEYSESPLPYLADTVWYLRAGTPDLMATPADAEFEFWVELMPDEDREEVLHRFEAHLRGFANHEPYLKMNPPSIDRMRMRPFTGTQVDSDHEIIRSLIDSGGKVTGRKPERIMGNAANDAMIFNLYSSTPAVVYGAGSTLTAHAPDEQILIEDVIAMTKCLALTISDFCGVK